MTDPAAVLPSFDVVTEQVDRPVPPAAARRAASAALHAQGRGHRRDRRGATARVHRPTGCATPPRPGSASRPRRRSGMRRALRHRTGRVRRFAFADESDCTSVLIVPRVVIGRRDGVSLDHPDRRGQDARDRHRPRPRVPRLSAPRRAHAGRLPRGGRAGRRAHPGRRLEKVVLARDLVGHLPAGADLRRVLVDLALGYPDTWTFAVDGLIGSSPETLVRVDARHRHGARARRHAPRAAPTRRRRGGRARPRHLDEGSRRAPVRGARACSPRCAAHGGASPRANCRSPSSCRISGTWRATSRAR